MHMEISVALNFMISYLYNKLPRRRVDMFGEAVEKGLKKKFEGHWYPDKPIKGTGYRCVRVNGEHVDPVIINSALECGLDLEEVKSYLPTELTIWIDPCEVSYRIGEKGPVKMLYSEREEAVSVDTADHEVQAAGGRGFNPDAQCFKPIDNLSSSFGNLSLSPGGLSPSSPVSSTGWPGSASTSPSLSLFNSCVGTNMAGQQGPQQPSKPSLTPYMHKADGGQTHFTAASFAQTKFGSTKLKSTAKRPTRLSPTEFGNFLRQRSTGNLPSPSGPSGPSGLISPQRPRSLSPRDPRVEFYIDQQQRAAYWAQQQQQQKQLQLQQLQFSQPHQQHHVMKSPHESFHSPLQEGFPSPMSNASHGQAFGNMTDLLPGPSPMQSPLPSPANSTTVSPDGHKTFVDGMGLTPVTYTNQHSHLLLAN